jgi:hypothetical protein
VCTSAKTSSNHVPPPTLQNKVADYESYAILGNEPAMFLPQQLSDTASDKDKLPLTNLKEGHSAKWNKL